MGSTHCWVFRFIVLFAVSPTALGTTWYVNGTRGSDINACTSPTIACKTLDHAISLAASGDSIRVAAATYYENLTIRISLRILGAGSTKTIIDGGNFETVLKISSKSAQVVLSNVTIQNGLSFSGGGVYNSGQLTITGSTVSGNLVRFPCSFPPPCFQSGAVLGGGLYNAGSVTINRSTFNNNVASIGPCVGACRAHGGGIYNTGTLIVNNSTFDGNGTFVNCSINCSSSGGGIYSGGILEINNSTFSGNSSGITPCKALCGASGGAIAGTGTISNSTIAGNSAPSYGGIDGGTLQNTIIANNSGGNCTGGVTSKGYNMSSDDTCNLGGPGDRNNTNPKLGPLQYNGGPTQTQALLVGSPAIDAGNPSGCRDSNGNLLKMDQRGMPRPDKEDIGGCDIGAYESQTD
jgi:hypothetical protein